VNRQVARLRERLTALLTDISLLPRMRQHVPIQAFGSEKCPTTRLACMRFRMRFHVWVGEPQIVHRMDIRSYDVISGFHDG
jgi:hypothetical protein